MSVYNKSNFVKKEKLLCWKSERGKEEEEEEEEEEKEEEEGELRSGVGSDKNNILDKS
jgi:hypothetical protein